MEEILALVFDMDGVLLDSETVSDRTFRLAAREYGISNIEEIIKGCKGMNSKNMIQYIEENASISVDNNNFSGKDFLSHTSELFYEIEAKEGLKAMPFAVDTLKYLKPKYKLAVATSTRKAAAERQLKSIGVLDFFDTIIYGDEVTESKPAPEIYLKACSSLEIAPEKAVAIEDAPNGIRSATSAGMKAIMVPDQIAPTPEVEKLCWKVLPDLSALKEIL